ncbi:MAG: methyltransferase domain-containing protein [Vicinamibacterales bacterium]|nr:methyltransferase domain-containing protein [Vicinamibacterales bacterium]
MLKHLLIALVVALCVARPSALQLGSRSAEEWVKTLDTPERVAGLRIDEAVAKLRLTAGQTVADIGAGTGLFEGALASAVTPKGTVYAVDVEQGLLDHIAKRASDLKVTNVRTVLGKFTDPSLPSRNIDLALINDVLHHIEDRQTYLKNLAGYLKPTGKIAVIDFRPNLGGHLNQPELRITKEQTDSWMAAAGLKPVEEIDLYTDKFFVVYSR